MFSQLYFPSTVRRRVKGRHWDPDAWLENQKKLRSLTGAAKTHTPSANANKERGSSTWISELCRGVSSAGGFSSVLNLWSHGLNTVTHLSSPKWFLFISRKSPNQSWKLNAVRGSRRVQPHSLSLWKWTAAAESSDVLSRGDGEALNVSCDLCFRCLWRKAFVRDSTNRVPHLTPDIGAARLLPPRPFSASRPNTRAAHRDHPHLLKRAKTESKSEAPSDWWALSQRTRMRPGQSNSSSGGCILIAWC